MSRPIHSNDERGFALAALIIFLTAFSIAAAAVVPAYQTQARREQEQEMIFRGQEYVRAIQKYQRSFGIYPPDIESLLDTNGIRFLRRPYTNPITGEGFRLLTINPDGSINGSVTYEAMMENPDLFMGGDPRMFGEGQPTNSFANQNLTVGGGLSGAPRQGGPQGGGGTQQGGFGGVGGEDGGFGQQNQGFGQAGGFGGGFGGRGGQPQAGLGQNTGFGGGFPQAGAGVGQQNQGFGQAVAPNNQGGRGNFGQSGFGQGEGRGGGLQGRGGAGESGARQGGFGQGGGFGEGGGFGSSPFGGDPFGSTPTTPTDSSGAGGLGNASFGSSGVVGVAPLDESPSLIAYNNREMYHEWEFIAMPGFGTVPMTSPFAGQQSGFGGETPFGQTQDNPFGQSPPANPFEQP